MRPVGENFHGYTHARPACRLIEANVLPSIAKSRGINFFFGPRDTYGQKSRIENASQTYKENAKQLGEGTSIVIMNIFPVLVPTSTVVTEKFT